MEGGGPPPPLLGRVEAGSRATGLRGVWGGNAGVQLTPIAVSLKGSAYSDYSGALRFVRLE